MYIRVHVMPDARKERVVKEGEAEYRISVKEPARQNRANTRIREILAGTYDVSVTHVRIVTGHRSSRKIYSVEGKENVIR